MDPQYTLAVPLSGALLTNLQIDKTKLGGTMRLGKHACVFQEGTEWSKLRGLYGDAPEIYERHRHRYEVNPEMISTLESAGLTFVGKDTKGERMGVFELKNHPYYVGTQFHAEYQSKVLDPSVSLASLYTTNPNPQTSVDLQC